MKYILLITSLLISIPGVAQKAPPGYTDSLKVFQENYIDSHEIVKGHDKQFFRFFAPDQNYRVNASFEKLNDSIGFIMKTSGTQIQQYFRYGKLSFVIHDTVHYLFIYQSKSLLTIKEYKDYLFLPFTDLTTGDDTYGGGRYIDLLIVDIKANTLLVDFNKAYNPYCAYAVGYNCPIPPKENYLPVAI